MRFHDSTSVGGWPVFGRRVARLREDGAFERATEEGLASVEDELRPGGRDLAQAETDGAGVGGALALQRRGEPVEGGLELVPELRAFSEGVLGLD
jgi:hypothetical protein